MLKELIRALYEIVKAIKGNNENGGSVSSNGLLGADAVAWYFGASPNNEHIAHSLEELYEQVHEAVGGSEAGFFGGYSPILVFLYEKDDIDLSNKPRNGQLANGYVIPSEYDQGAISTTGNMQIYFCTQDDIDSERVYITEYKDTGYYHIALD